MRPKTLWIASLVTTMLVVVTSVSAEVNRTAYPRLEVELGPAYTPDAAFRSFRSQFINAVAKKDANALFALVAPGFVWTLDNSLSSDFDPGRDAQHNFRVVFGFRGHGMDMDGKVEGGPFWDALAAFANDGTYNQSSEAGNLVCSPIAAAIADEEAFEQARSKVETDDEAADWYFIVRSTAVTKAPGDKGAPIAKLGVEAVPVLNVHPAATNGEAAPKPTHYEVLLPSGRTGWIAASAARSLQTDRLCYALTANGEWKIAIYDAVE
jgi:hypothetical protein